MLNVPYIVRHADELWHKIRWGETGVVKCVCGCDKIYRLSDGRYKCAECGKIFSDRSGTLLHHSKLGVEIWLIGIFKFACCKECSAMDLMRECGVNYKTAYMMLQKLRYVAGKEEILLDGIVRIDEAYIGAEWHNVHFNKKMQYMRSNGFIDKDSKRYTKHQLLRAVSAKKFHTLSLTDEHNRTRVIHTPNPVSKEIIKSIIFNGINNITAIVSDESNLYKNIGIPVYQSCHSKRVFMTENGMTSNIAENHFSWTKRKWNGVYTHTSEKYLQLYLNQRQWHFNCMSLSVDERFYKLVGLCQNNVVRNKDIYDFDYTEGFPKSRRKMEEELSHAVAHNPFVESVEDRYGRKYKPK